jgi:hypothetical protein
MTAVTGAPATRRRSEAGASPRDEPAVGRTVVPLTAGYFRQAFWPVVEDAICDDAGIAARGGGGLNRARRRSRSVATRCYLLTGSEEALACRAAIPETEPVTERLQVREIDDDEGQRLARIIRRGSIGALYWASVSNPASPFVDMVSGAQGTAANAKEPAMSAVTTSPTTSPDIAAGPVPSRLTSTLPRATVSAGVLAAAVTTAGAVALRAAGVPLAVHGKIPLAGFAQVTVIAAVLGGVLLALLNRRSSTPRQRFVRITTGLTAISCALPAAFADTTASKVALVGLHLAAAAIIVPVLARHAR